MAVTKNNTIFDGLKGPRNLTQYTLMRGVTDFGNIGQFNLYETGYSFIKVVKVPTFLQKLADTNSAYKNLLDNYVHILEYEFRGLEGLSGLDSDTFELTNGISTLNIINKVSLQSAAQISMRFFEKSGAPITKLHELFLTGIKDPRTEIKTYHGLIKGINGVQLEDGYENEVFTLMYGVCDNTFTKIERAFLLLCAQPTKADFDMYNSEKGTIQNKEISVEMNCFPVSGPKVYEKAQIVLDTMNKTLITQSTDFNYTGIEGSDK